MNEAIFAGRLGRDAELRYTPAGAAVATFPLAVEEYHKGEKVTTWVDCNIWADKGEKIAPYLTKGSAVTVAGEVSTRAWRDKASGEVRSALQLRVWKITLQGGGKPREAEPERDLTPRAVKEGDPGHGDFDDDIPF